ncbi:MAG: ribbon-helix-helix protein, CopG family [Ilumatobacteraceae bacterium]
MAKVMISLPDELLARLDLETRRRATTRSGLLHQAIRRELDHLDVEAVRAALDDVRVGIDAAGKFEAADLVRAARDARR